MPQSRGRSGVTSVTALWIALAALGFVGLVRVEGARGSIPALMRGPLGAGDVNGDGLADVVVTGPASPLDGKGETSAYVIFGKRDLAGVDRRQPEFGGFRNDHVRGVPALTVGDFNGDGLDDVVVLGRAAHRRSLFVVFGKHDQRPVDIHHLGNDGLTVLGVRERGTTLIAPAGPAGDVDGDGLADIYVEAFIDGGNSRARVVDYIVHGRRRGGVLDLLRRSAAIARLTTFDGGNVRGAGISTATASAIW